MLLPVGGRAWRRALRRIWEKSGPLSRGWHLTYMGAHAWCSKRPGVFSLLGARARALACVSPLGTRHVLHVSPAAAPCPRDKSCLARPSWSIPRDRVPGEIPSYLSRHGSGRMDFARLPRILVVLCLVLFAASCACLASRIADRSAWARCGAGAVPAWQLTPKCLTRPGSGEPFWKEGDGVGRRETGGGGASCSS